MTLFLNFSNQQHDHCHYSVVKIDDDLGMSGSRKGFVSEVSMLGKCKQVDLGCSITLNIHHA